jgi:hypothetical protein
MESTSRMCLLSDALTDPRLPTGCPENGLSVEVETLLDRIQPDTSLSAEGRGHPCCLGGWAPSCFPCDHFHRDLFMQLLPLADITKMW